MSELTGLKDEKTPEWLDLEKNVSTKIHSAATTTNNNSNDQASLLRSRTKAGISTLVGKKSLMDTHNSIYTNNNHNGDQCIEGFQRIAAMLAILLSYVCLILVCVWVNDEAMGVGGVSWKQEDAGLVFNWHPVMMILTFIFMTNASLTFRFHWTKRLFAKSSHVLLWSTAIMTASIGIHAVLQSHNDPINGYIANFYSFHSWLASTINFLFLIQFIVGIVFFGFNLSNICCWLSSSSSSSSSSENQKMKMTMKKLMLLLHRFLGKFLYVATGATIMTGIHEKVGFINCSYTTNNQKDSIWNRQGKIPQICHTSHTLALFILLLTFLTTFALYDFTISLSYHHSSILLLSPYIHTYIHTYILTYSFFKPKKENCVQTYYVLRMTILCECVLQFVVQPQLK